MRSIGHRVRPGLEIREGHDAAGYPGHRGPYESPRPNPRVQANDGANPYGGCRPRESSDTNRGVKRAAVSLGQGKGGAGRVPRHT